mmetsp:Transcript_30426/g.46848  ORF Transcript_30426/g.46848 Transcript_30426/m.46848 type:complete len:248 (+) Transcript_30426:318-1061(+)
MQAGVGTFLHKSVECGDLVGLNAYRGYSWTATPILTKLWCRNGHGGHGGAVEFEFGCGNFKHLERGVGHVTQQTFGGKGVDGLRWMRGSRWSCQGGWFVPIVVTNCFHQWRSGSWCGGWRCHWFLRKNVNCTTCGSRRRGYIVKGAQIQQVDFHGCGRRRWSRRRGRSGNGGRNGRRRCHGRWSRSWRRRCGSRDHASKECCRHAFLFQLFCRFLNWCWSGRRWLSITATSAVRRASTTEGCGTLSG